MQTQLTQDFTDVILDRLFAQMKLSRNLFVAQPLREQSQDVALPASEGNLRVGCVEVIGSWFGACMD
jgi:hypothetical protein